MTQYIVSARKYRPENFETLIGQDNIAQTLKNSIIRGKLAHAYLFCGPRGVGKTTTARIFAKIINCSSPSQEMEPCGQCESCVSFNEGRSYCIQELDAASNNGVDDIKALMDMVRIPPQVGKYSVYIIDEVHMLSSQAFNAFLKTLEEPPAHAIFILATTEKHKILPTILSRCQTYDFNRITIENIVRNLRMIAQKEAVTIDDESLHIIANKADGAMRDALTIFDQTVAFCGTDVKYKDVIENLNVLDYEYSFGLVDAFLAGDYAFALKKFDEVLTKGFNALHFIGSLSSHFRDLMVSKSGGLTALLELPDSLKEKYREQAERCSIAFLYEALSLATTCEASYRTSVNPRLHIEFTLMKLAFILNKPTLGAQVPIPTVPVPSPAPAPAPAPAPEQEPVSELTKAPDGMAASQAAPEPAIVNEPEAVVAPTPRRRAARAGISIKAITQPVEVAVEEVKVDSDEVSVITDEEIRQRWPLYAESYSDKPRLLQMLKSSEIDIMNEGEEKFVTFNVHNTAQVAWVENMLRELEGRLQKIMGSNIVRLKVKMDESLGGVVAPAILPSEKAKELMGKNSDVAGLVKDLSLDC